MALGGRAVEQVTDLFHRGTECRSPAQGVACTLPTI